LNVLQITCQLLYHMLRKAASSRWNFISHP
jgi:hypothetical protein